MPPPLQPAVVALGRAWFQGDLIARANRGGKLVLIALRLADNPRSWSDAVVAGAGVALIGTSE